jgi:hypothetical protein
VGDTGKPGQIIHQHPSGRPVYDAKPFNTDIMDDMGKYASPMPYNPHGSSAPHLLTRRGNPNGTSALDLAKRVTWEDFERLNLVTTAVCAIKHALAKGARLEEITRLL